MIFMAAWIFQLNLQPRFSGRNLSVGAAFSLWTSCCISEERLDDLEWSVGLLLMAEIWRENQLIWYIYVNIPIIYSVLYIQTVVGNGISEPSTV